MFNEKKIRTIGKEDDVWFCGKDIAQILGYKNEREAIKDHVGYDDKMALSTILSKIQSAEMPPHKFNKNDLKTIYINRRGLICFLTYSKLPNKDSFIKYCKDSFDINYDIITRLYKEQETIGQLIKVFNYKKIKTQYVVNSCYKIDLYFIDDKLAIECDEFGHQDRHNEYEVTREESIKNTLNCDFIRYNPDCPNFDIFNLIQEIIIKLNI